MHFTDFDIEEKEQEVPCELVALLMNMVEQLTAWGVETAHLHVLHSAGHLSICRAFHCDGHCKQSSVGPPEWETQLGTDVGLTRRTYHTRIYTI